MTDISGLLKKLGIKGSGSYENHFYIIPIANSDDYAKMYTLLSEKAINTEYPNFGKNSNNATTEIINYFTLDDNNITYNIFLIANFQEDKYQVRIGEQ